MTSIMSITEMERLIEAAANAGTDSELVELGRQIGADALFLVMSILGGPMGMQCYIPSPLNFAATLRRKLRDIAITTGYDGTPTSISAMAIEHGISKTRIRQIIAAQPGRDCES